MRTVARILVIPCTVVVVIFAYLLDISHFYSLTELRQLLIMLLVCPVTFPGLLFLLGATEWIPDKK